MNGAGHYEMYDEPAYVNEAVDVLDTFYKESLAAVLEDSVDADG
ncbi:hypothetical protein [Williamsia muralis]